MDELYKQILLNPIIIGIIIGVVVWLLLKFKNQDQEPDPTDKLNKKKIFFPLVAGIIGAIGAYWYFNETGSVIGEHGQATQTMQSIQSIQAIQAPQLVTRLAQPELTGGSAGSVHVLSKGITIPSNAVRINIPDVFIETY